MKAIKVTIQTLGHPPKQEWVDFPESSGVPEVEIPKPPGGTNEYPEYGGEST